MKLVLDASMALAWCIARNDPFEAALAQEALNFIRLNSAQVPALWYPEIVNTLLVFERAKRLSLQISATFLNDLDTLQIHQDLAPVAQTRPRLLSIARKHNLTAYDATYLEFALRIGSTLATFDQKLAAAARSSDLPVFGDKE